MDGFDSAGLQAPIDPTPIPIPRAPGGRWSGWLIGAVLGVIASLWAFPSVRYTLSAQIEFALAEDSIPWLSGLDAQRTAREVPRLDQVAARFPDDYLLQVGRATALATAGGTHSERTASGHVEMTDHHDQTLLRIGAVTRAFSTTPGVYAHLARYLMAERIRIHRAELRSPKAPGGPPAADATEPLSGRDLRIMVWALQSGERLDADNAFWPAMLATTYIAARQDPEALQALARASRKPRWDAYIYEEVLGQWRLYSEAYGDHGALQKIGPLSLVVFPHLHEIRLMAEMARWHAERAAAKGRKSEAARIRRNLTRLGANLRDNARWAFEALYGTDLFFIACTDSDSRLTPSSIRTPAEWEQQAVNYRRLLQSIGREYEFRLVRSEVQISCDLRKRVDLARYDASYPGIPPGIPLIPLFGNWMAGICLVQQALGVLLAGTIAWAIGRAAGRGLFDRLRWRAAALVLGSASLVAGAGIFLTSITSPRMAGLLLACLSVLALTGMETAWRGVRGHRRAPREAETAAGAPSANTARTAEVDAKWTRGTTVRMLLLVAVPYLAILYMQRPVLSGLHPVAILLTSLTGPARAASGRDAIELAFLGSALPLLLPPACGLWGLYRGLSPAAAALVGVRRLALPCLVCLVAAYAVLLNRMLVLDAEASQAIQKAAQNDRQWVLTHGSDNPF